MEKFNTPSIGTTYYVYDLDTGKLKQTFTSYRECCKFLKIGLSTFNERFKKYPEGFDTSHYRVEKDTLSMTEIKSEVEDVKTKTTYTVSKRKRETKIFSTLAEVEKYTKITSSRLSNHFKKEGDTVIINLFTIKREKQEGNEKLINELFLKRFEEVKRHRVERSTSILNEALKRKEEEDRDLSKEALWERHCRETCTRSIDDLFWIPNSLIEEFPKLRYHTMPKSMF